MTACLHGRGWRLTQGTLMAPSDFFCRSQSSIPENQRGLKNRTASLVSSLGCAPQPERSPPCRLECAAIADHGWNDRGGTAAARRAPQTLITKIARCAGASGARDRQSRRAPARDECSSERMTEASSFTLLTPPEEVTK